MYPHPTGLYYTCGSTVRGIIPPKYIQAVMDCRTNVVIFDDGAVLKGAGEGVLSPASNSSQSSYPGGDEPNLDTGEADRQPEIVPSTLSNTNPGEGLPEEADPPPELIRPPPRAHARVVSVFRPSSPWKRR